MDSGDRWGDQTLNLYSSKLFYEIIFMTSNSNEYPLSYNSRLSSRLSVDSMDPRFPSLNTDFPKKPTLMRQSSQVPFLFLFQLQYYMHRRPSTSLSLYSGDDLLSSTYEEAYEPSNGTLLIPSSSEPLYPKDSLLSYPYDEGEFLSSTRQGRSFSEIELSSLPNSYEPAFSLHPFPPRTCTSGDSF